MKLVVGLGNPGPEYKNTRHNVGFEVLGELARRHGASKPKIKFEAEFAEAVISDEKTLLLAPQTFMNLSGRSIRKCVQFFQLSLVDLVVICDDMNLKLGQLRLRPSGSAGGQLGLMNTIQNLSTEDFPRFRIGIGRPLGKMAATDFVLSRFKGTDRETIDFAIQDAATGVETWICDGLDKAMNRVNAPPSDS